MRETTAALLALVAGVALAACSSDDGSSTTPGQAGGAGGSAATAGIGGTAGTAGGGAGSGGAAGTGSGGTTSGAAGSAASSGAAGSDAAGAGGSAAGSAPTGGSSGSGGGSAGSAGASSADLTLTALAANQTVGLEWNPVAGAEEYRVHYASGAPAALGDPALDIAKEHTTAVHRGLTNGTEYHYLVTAVVGGAEAGPSNDASATPEGEWVLEELGSGRFEDVSTGMPVPTVPLEKRVQVLLFAEGYTAADLDVLHTVSSHDGNRANDIDRWVDEVFRIPPYADYREAFVVWYLPRASAAHSNEGDTAFAVPVSNGALATPTSETAARTWAAIALNPVPPMDFSGGGFGTLRTHVAAFLIFDPQSGRAGLSGLTTSLRNPDDSQQRIATAFAMGHAHEFTHAFSAVRDEYLEDDNAPPQGSSPQSNVVASNVCSDLPWQHLLSGGAINPATDELVGAFGRSTHGFHSELLCLMNGTHDNATYYGGNGTLRPSDRMCNFCREVTAYWVYARTGVLDATNAGFDTWMSDYRSAYFERFPFFVPGVVPQTNNVQNPSQGMAFYEACTAASHIAPLMSSARGPGAAKAARSGCIVDEE